MNVEVDKNITEYFSNVNKLKKEVGKDLAKSIIKRVCQLQALPNIKSLMESGLDNPHFLHGNFDGCIGWSVNRHIRLILYFNPSDAKDKEDALKLDVIYIKGVVDYHGNKDEWIIS